MSLFDLNHDIKRVFFLWYETSGLRSLRDAWGTNAFSSTSSSRANANILLCCFHSLAFNLSIILLITFFYRIINVCRLFVSLIFSRVSHVFTNHANISLCCLHSLAFKLSNLKYC